MQGRWLLTLSEPEAQLRLARRRGLLPSGVKRGTGPGGSPSSAEKWTLRLALRAAHRGSHLTQPSRREKREADSHAGRGVVRGSGSRERAGAEARLADFSALARAVPSTWRALPAAQRPKPQHLLPGSPPAAGRSPAAPPPGPGARAAPRPGLPGRLRGPQTARRYHSKVAARGGRSPSSDPGFEPPLPSRTAAPGRAGLLPGLRGGASLPSGPAPAPAAPLNFGEQRGGGCGRGPPRPARAHPNAPLEQVARAAAGLSQPFPSQAPLPAEAGASPGQRPGPPPTHPPHGLCTSGSRGGWRRITSPLSPAGGSTAPVARGVVSAAPPAAPAESGVPQPACPPGSGRRCRTIPSPRASRCGVHPGSPCSQLCGFIIHCPHLTGEKTEAPCD